MVNEFEFDIEVAYNRCDTLQRKVASTPTAELDMKDLGRVAVVALLEIAKQLAVGNLEVEGEE
jgi:hypothetical protein